MAQDQPILPNIDISFVLPVYNSAETLFELYERIAAVCQYKLGLSFETIWIDDYSHDESWEVLTQLQAQYPQTVTAIRLSKNFGQHNATICGIAQAQGKCVVTLDDDLQMHPEDVPQLYAIYQVQGCDLVYGVMTEAQKGILRRSVRNWFGKIQRWEGRNRGRGSSFRLLSRQLCQKLLRNAHGFVFIDEICLWHTRKIAFIEVPFYPSRRRVAQSRYGLGALLNLSFSLIVFSSNLPLRLMTLLGFSASLLSFVGILVLLLRKIVKNVPMGYTSIMVAICFSTAIILFCLGVVGEYLNKVYRLQKRMPLYSIDEIRTTPALV